MDTVQNGRRELDTEQDFVCTWVGLRVWTNGTGDRVNARPLEMGFSRLSVRDGAYALAQSDDATCGLRAEAEFVHGMRHARISGLATRMPRNYAGLAQLVEQTPCKRQVKCSSHLSGLSRLAPYRKIGANHSWPGGGSD